MKTLPAMFFTALILGLTWAVRGSFGHEWGAAWAGATGALAVLVASGRPEWFRRMPVLAALGAIGWGAGGMMSYGIVIGYCRADTFFNSLYGYAMLTVIGGLYGYIGGGLLGLGLETSDQKKPNWFLLSSGMVAGGCLFWGIVVNQLGWFMTPPRSEAWGLCAGAALALTWYLCQEGFPRALRVAVYSGLGGGFGFCVGNFIQTVGSISGVAYNWWNVMEFTLGFCGGLGMAYAVSTTRWPEPTKPTPMTNWIALFLVTSLIPWTNLVDAFTSERFLRLAENLGIEDATRFAWQHQMFGLALVAIVAIGSCINWKWHQQRDDRAFLRLGSFVVFAYTLYYVIFCFLVRGFFYRSLSISSSDTMYLPIFFLAAAIWLFAGRGKVTVNDGQETSLNAGVVPIASIVVAAVFAVAAATVTIHDGKIRFHERFPIQEQPAASAQAAE
ncbi:MAG: hypothetical protein KDA57_06555 [Planctomycetales bacterium]|nr:hypothetical protein [Planctomycetales bacterium]